MASVDQITLNDIGKKYHRQWIFKSISTSFDKKEKTAIVGSNGSGKSTFLKLLSAAEIPSAGKLTYQLNSTKEAPLNEVYQHLCFAAPYMDLPEQLTPLELLRFHKSFKSFYDNMSEEEFLDNVYLQESKDQLIKNFSSGMKQRLKLGLAICSVSDVLLLDEPCSNLDKEGIRTYHRLMNSFSNNRIVVISSNEQADEMMNSTRIINIMDYKS